ncbi:MAG: hypothetical protein ACYSUI_11810 [Planctomycetota bacterium]
MGIRLTDGQCAIGALPSVQPAGQPPMNPADLPPLSEALPATISEAGYVVGLGRDGEAVVITASDSEGERHIVRGATAYVALCELAQQLWFD